MDLLEDLKQKYDGALSRREALIIALGSDTDAFRLVHSDADGIPGITVDRLGEVLLMETHIPEVPTDLFLEILRERHGPSTPIFLKERRGADMVAKQGRQVSGPDRDPVVQVQEEGLVFELKLTGTPHTGLFLDSRAVRRRVKAAAPGKRVLNLFSYTGGFGMAAQSGGARSTTNIDSKVSALEAAKRNYLLTGLPVDSRTFLKSDALSFLKKSKKNNRPYDLVILDPPPVSKRTNRDILDTGRAYARLVARALGAVADGGTLIAGLNNQEVDDPSFYDMITAGLTEAGRRAARRARIATDPDFPPGSRRPTARFEEMEGIQFSKSQG